MDNTMSSWSSVLKQQIIKNDDFTEDYGFFNDADIANWFKTLESTFEQMLDKIGVGSNPNSLEELTDLLEGGYKPKANKKLSNNQRQIKRIGTDIATLLLQECMEKFMTEYSKTMEDDNERSIRRMLGSQAYSDTLEAVFDFTESLLSSIFDACYEVVRYNADRMAMKNITPDDPSRTIVPIDPDEPLTPEVKEIVTQILTQELEDSVPDAIQRATTQITQNLTGDKAMIGEAVKDTLEEVMFSPEMGQLLEDFGAYVYQSFFLKLPLQQMAMSRNELVADQTTEEEANRPEIKYGEEYGQARKKFEEEFKSNDKYRYEHDWFSILSKETGVGMTTSAGFTPAIHNLKYGEKPCERCNDKTTPCGCDD